MTDGIRWLIDIIPLPCPYDVDAAPETYRTAWRKHVGLIAPAGGDREDWMEQAARLEAATRILPNPVVRLAGQPSPVTEAEAMRMPHYGMRTLTPRMDQTLIPQNADQYALFPGLPALYGRRTRLVACDETTIKHTVRAMLGDCPNGLKLKFVACAKTVRMADVKPDGNCTLLQDDGTPYSGPFDAFHWLGWTLPRFDGAPNAVLIQERVPIHDEYRIHMIGGTPACGAGCIEAFTPADNTGSRFDPRTQHIRDPQQPVEQHHELIDEYIRLAKQAHDLIRHNITGAYAIDMYQGTDNRPHVLELNAHANSGLYALDMTSLLTAIRANPQEFTPKETP